MFDTIFRKAVVLIGAHDEVISLRETVEGIASTCRPEDVARILVFLAPHATEACLSEANRLAAAGFPIPVAPVREEQADWANELQHVLGQQVDASHAVFWTADLDAPPSLVAFMVEQARQNPAAVIKPSRFIPGGRLPVGKGAYVNLRDALFRWIVCMFYQCRQTDPHLGLALFPIRDFIRFDFREKFMSFAIEYLLCFERLRTPFIEIPLQQRKRSEGKSNISARDRLRFLVPVIRLRFLPKRKLLKEGSDEQA